MKVVIVHWQDEGKTRNMAFSRNAIGREEMNVLLTSLMFKEKQFSVTYKKV